MFEYKKKVKALTDAALKTGFNLLKLLNGILEISGKLLYKGLLKLKRVRTRAVATAVSVALCLTVTAAVYAVESRNAVEIFYNGKSFSIVADKDIAESLTESLCREVHGKLEIGEFSLKPVTTTANLLSDAETVASRLRSGGNGINAACGLYVDGILKAVCESADEMQALLDSARDTYLAEGGIFKGYANSVVLSEIYVTDGYFSEHKATAEKMINGDYDVRFLTLVTDEYEEAVPYATSVEYTSSKKQGYEKITTQGEDGLRTVVAHVTYLNGERISAQEIESRITVSSVNEVKLVGTKKTPVRHSGYVLASSIKSDSKSELYFPIECTSNVYITSFWGDDRGHKGIDISAPSGTEIYSAADGTVSYSGYRSDYGYVIIVDHNDGKTQTVYSHNKKNLVTVGDKVTVGQTIACVGATGNATGNHLHFEVRINGSAVDPTPYVGLK